MTRRMKSQNSAVSFVLGYRVFSPATNAVKK